MAKTLKAYSDLDLDPTKLNIEIVIFIYYNLFEFLLEYSIVVFSKTRAEKYKNVTCKNDQYQSHLRWQLKITFSPYLTLHENSTLKMDKINHK